MNTLFLIKRRRASLCRNISAPKWYSLLSCTRECTFKLLSYEEVFDILQSYLVKYYIFKYTENEHSVYRGLDNITMITRFYFTLLYVYSFYY